MSMKAALRARLRHGAAQEAVGLCLDCGDLVCASSPEAFSDTVCPRCGARCFQCQGVERSGPDDRGKPPREAWLARQGELVREVVKIAEASPPTIRSAELETWLWRNRFPWFYFELAQALTSIGRANLRRELEKLQMNQ